MCPHTFVRMECLNRRACAGSNCVLKRSLTTVRCSAQKKVTFIDDSPSGKQRSRSWEPLWKWATEREGKSWDTPIPVETIKQLAMQVRTLKSMMRRKRKWRATTTAEWKSSHMSGSMSRHEWTATYKKRWCTLIGEGRDELAWCRSDGEEWHCNAPFCCHNCLTISLSFLSSAYPRRLSTSALSALIEEYISPIAI